MNWFDNQIEERRAGDEELLENAFLKAAGAVMGNIEAEKLRDERIIAKDAVGEILKYYHFKPVELPESIKTPEEHLNFSLRPHGIMYRSVELKEKWYLDAFGPMLGFTSDEGLPVALIPGRAGGYTFRDPNTGKQRKVNEKNAALICKDALCFYRPLPQKALKIPDLLSYMKSCVTMYDMAQVVVMTFLVSFVGLVMPRLIQLLTGPVISSGKQSAVLGIAISMVTVQLTSQLISSVSALASDRLNTKISMGVESSMMMRVLSFPTSFFRQYGPGDLRSRMRSVGTLSDMLVRIVMTTSLSSLTSLLYVAQIFRFAPVLVVPSVVLVLITVAFSVVSSLAQMRLVKRRMELSAKESGISYGLLTGVQKLKLSGSEKRGFAKWLDVYSEGASLAYDPPLFLKINSVISTGISLVGTIVLYYLSVESKVSPSDYYAFTSAYSMLMGAFTSVSGIALTAAQVKPILEMAEPFLKTVPESSEEKEILTSLSGRIELDHVSFKYDENDPYILNDLSLSVNPGDYIAIVGKTGCGKSTLVRLLLGFEKPEKGAIYYDSKDLGGIDLRSLRGKIGTVMQDAGLFQGDIYSNIVITAPGLSMQDAWEAAETAGIAEDIRDMPMGMHTLVSEGGGGISGGQKQRLMIARAIAPKPKILIFDEATSALDNKTQHQVSEALDHMGCTRIVIAHRLSTIRHCDRIVVLDGGRIIEDGTYDELIAQGGFFAQLVERQRPDAAS